MKRFLMTLFLFLSLSVFADTFYCPMKCEGEKIYSAQGTCPVCGMNLEKKLEGEAARPLNTRDYRIDLTMKPASAKPGEKVIVELSPKRTKDNSVVKELDVVHEKLMHLILVSQELDWFAHEHPVQQPDGVFKLDTTFPRAGNFILFADVTPKGERNQVFPLALQVEGKKPKAASLKVSPKGPKKVGGYSVAMAVSPAAVTGEPVTLTFKVNKGGKPVSDLQPYLGALGHVVGISEDTTQFIHAHPPGGHDHAHHGEVKGGGPEVSFMTAFPRPGLYKVWGQFQHQGQMVIADFVLSVKDKK